MTLIPEAIEAARAQLLGAGAHHEVVASDGPHNILEYFDLASGVRYSINGDRNSWIIEASPRSWTRQYSSFVWRAYFAGDVPYTHRDSIDEQVEWILDPLTEARIAAVKDRRGVQQAAIRQVTMILGFEPKS